MFVIKSAREIVNRQAGLRSGIAHEIIENCKKNAAVKTSKLHSSIKLVDKEPPIMFNILVIVLYIALLRRYHQDWIV